MTHVPEHLAQLGEGRGRAGPRLTLEPPPGRPEPKGKAFEPRDRRGTDLPPILPPG